MSKLLLLSPRIQKQILRYARDRGLSPDSMFRLRMVLAVAQGQARRAVAAVFLCAVSAVVRAVQRFVVGGFEALDDRRQQNGSRKLSPAYLGRLQAVLDHRADEFGWQRPTWTREALALTMAEQSFPLCAPCTVGRALKVIGARRGRPKPAVTRPWSDKLRDKLLRSLRRLEAAASDEQPVVFVDEVDLHLNPKVGLDWMNQGTQRELLTPGKNQKHYLAGALDSRTRQLFWVDGLHKNSQLFCELLDVLCEAYPDAKTIYVILDNYGIHTSRLVDKKLSALGGGASSFTSYLPTVRVESSTGAVALGSGELLLPTAFACCVGASFRSIAPFPVPARRTEHADFPHSALLRCLMLSRSVG